MWLCSSGLNGEMESLIIAAQDKALNMCYHQRNIMKQPNDSKGRMCCMAQHITLGGYIQWMICKHMGLQVTDKYYEHTPENVRNANGTTIMWDVPVITD